MIPFKNRLKIDKIYVLLFIFFCSATDAFLQEDRVEDRNSYRRYDYGNERKTEIDNRFVPINDRRHFRMSNIRNQIGRETLFNNRRIVDSDSIMSNAYDRRIEQNSRFGDNDQNRQIRIDRRVNFDRDSDRRSVDRSGIADRNNNGFCSERRIVERRIQERQVADRRLDGRRSSSRLDLNERRNVVDDRRVQERRLVDRQQIDERQARNVRDRQLVEDRRINRYRQDERRIDDRRLNEHRIDRRSALRLIPTVRENRLDDRRHNQRTYDNTLRENRQIRLHERYDDRKADRISSTRRDGRIANRRTEDRYRRTEKNHDRRVQLKENNRETEKSTNFSSIDLNNNRYDSIEFGNTSLNKSFWPNIVSMILGLCLLVQMAKNSDDKKKFSRFLNYPNLIKEKVL